MADDESSAPAQTAPQTRKLHCHAQFPKWLIEDLTPGSTIDRIVLFLNHTTGKILRAQARLLGDYLYRNIIIDDPWILGAFDVRTDYGGYVRFPPATKLQFEPASEGNSDDGAAHPGTARLVDVTKVPASEAYARRHVVDVHDRSVTKSAAQQRVEAWWNEAVDYPETRRKQDVIGASNEDQVEAGPSSKRVQLHSQSDSAFTAPLAASAQSDEASNENGVVDLTGEPYDEAFLVQPQVVDRTARRRSAGSAITNVDAGAESDDTLANSDQLPAMSQRTPSAPEQPQAATTTPKTLAVVANLNVLRARRDNLRDQNDAFLTTAIQRPDPSFAHSPNIPMAKQFEIARADSELMVAESELKIARVERVQGYANPSGLAELEARVLESEIEIEERRNTLYKIMATSNGEYNSHVAARSSRVPTVAQPTPSNTRPAPSAPAQPAAVASGPRTTTAATKTAAVDALFALIKPNHHCSNRVTCKICRSTPSLPWLPSNGNGRRMAGILVRMNARLSQHEQLEFGRMYNLDRIAVSKKSSALRKEFHDRLQAFVVRHGVPGEYREFANLQQNEAKDRYYRLPLFEDK
jgi:hypothetical protein